MSCISPPRVELWRSTPSPAGKSGCGKSKKAGRPGAAWRGGRATAKIRPESCSWRAVICTRSNANSGADSAGFGNGGVVDIGVPYNSVPLIIDGVVIVGANTPPGQPGGIGNPRAFDVQTGDLLWEFASVAQPGDPANATWAGDSWRGRLGANAWPFYFTADPERSMVFLPLASPIPFAWGGDRAGDNLYANAIVAVNLHTGDYIWHFQTIHHDLWDHDPPAPASLFELEDGTPAMAFTTKSGYLFLLNRETGEPILEIIERPVPASEVPGEQTSPIQPVPSAPADLARTRFGMQDLVSAADTERPRTPPPAVNCWTVWEK